MAASGVLLRLRRRRRVLQSERSGAQARGHRGPCRQRLSHVDVPGGAADARRRALGGMVGPAQRAGHRAGREPPLRSRANLGKDGPPEGEHAADRRRCHGDPPARRAARQSRALESVDSRQLRIGRRRVLPPCEGRYQGPAAGHGRTDRRHGIIGNRHFGHGRNQCRRTHAAAGQRGPESRGRRPLRRCGRDRLRRTIGQHPGRLLRRSCEVGGSVPDHRWTSLGYQRRCRPARRGRHDHRVRARFDLHQLWRREDLPRRGRGGTAGAPRHQGRRGGRPARSALGRAGHWRRFAARRQRTARFRAGTHVPA